MQDKFSRIGQYLIVQIAAALAVVNIFETGKVAGSFSALAVLDDGAGISYGINQFTHRSGSLAAVVERYLEKVGTNSAGSLRSNLPRLKKRWKASIAAAAADTDLKLELQKAGATKEMREAQVEILFERYLKPAIEFCVNRGFRTTLSLAVIYDSLVHGHFQEIAAQIKAEEEHVWIAAYVAARDKWLASIPRLRKTQYRTRFFLGEIARNNWELRLPLIVNGRKLTDKLIDALVSDLSEHIAPTEDSADSSASNATSNTHETLDVPAEQSTPTDDCPPNESPLDVIESSVNEAAARYDHLERVVRTVTTRTDSAKSLWTTILGTVWQAIWALIGLVSGIPREVWLVVAVIAGVLAAIYLYRQLVLGRIRESRQGENNYA
jgi:hypothetical protein